MSKSLALYEWFIRHQQNSAQLKNLMLIKFKVNCNLGWKLRLKRTASAGNLQHLVVVFGLNAHTIQLMRVMHQQRL